ncbi:hypothetical protein FOL47_003070 [Perkinsus chesapeaki]|uniref:Uncharacterized protein n=1 Tax=Perkinsus chesapeaki TaxID=330153 RepID=A0A7J6MA13_PERCH|nr:hypothetical protein FOL47_003070 [Perkinsus chesapeaki]
MIDTCPSVDFETRLSVDYLLIKWPGQEHSCDGSSPMVPRPFPKPTPTSLWRAMASYGRNSFSRDRDPGKSKKAIRETARKSEWLRGMKKSAVFTTLRIVVSQSRVMQHVWNSTVETAERRIAVKRPPLRGV